MTLHDDPTPLIRRDPRRFAAIVATVVLGACALAGIFFGSGPSPSGGGHGSGHALTEHVVVQQPAAAERTATA